MVDDSFGLGYDPDKVAEEDALRFEEQERAERGRTLDEFIRLHLPQLDQRRRLDERAFQKLSRHTERYLRLDITNEEAIDKFVTDALRMQGIDFQSEGAYRQFLQDADVKEQGRVELINYKGLSRLDSYELGVARRSSRWFRNSSNTYVPGKLVSLAVAREIGLDPGNIHVLHLNYIRSPGILEVTEALMVDQRIGPNREGSGYTEVPATAHEHLGFVYVVDKGADGLRNHLLRNGHQALLHTRYDQVPVNGTKNKSIGRPRPPVLQFYDNVDRLEGSMKYDYIFAVRAQGPHQRNRDMPPVSELQMLLKPEGKLFVFNEQGIQPGGQY